MTIRIFELAVAIAPEHVGDRHGHLGPGADGALDERIDVLDEEMDSDG
jgi:hypothetical protein